MAARPLVDGLAQVILGDSTTHGGKVISGSPSTFFGPARIPVARVGDMTSCPLCPPHVFPIVQGHPFFTDNHMNVALHGHKTACGASLIAVAAPALISAVPGFDETGKNEWRKANDQVFKAAVNAYNLTYHLKSGDPGYWTAERLKAQAMIESGGTKSAFQTDPLQVNNSGDWDEKKATILGLNKDEKMTPAKSASAALKWMRFKGFVHNSNGEETSWRGDFEALRRYNGNTRVDKGAMEHRDWYGHTILKLEQEMLSQREP
ncbi:MAG TPA: PAAR domain-containing protein [Limnobacter sp.]|uniref:PAAR domain-containing protein n=1 Tax=Limnobacter sp. TaxID=2003368 RepID=UPI002E378A8F|nr:PAAR domain-containing protein [Limnobacter sp.]HEX5485954.1 PAAR domain-containing protein [Limnobacter sp.]